MNWKHVLLALLIWLPLTSAQAQSPVPRRQSAPATEWLAVGVGQSFIYKEKRGIARVLVSDGAIAEVKLLQAGQFQIRGISVGSTDLWVWFHADLSNPVHYQLTVHQDLSDLIRRMTGSPAYLDATDLVESVEALNPSWSPCP